MPMQRLPTSTSKLVTCAQIITSVSSVVKELVENALDAEATNIDIKLEGNGLDLIEVKDDGCGIAKTDMPNMCLPCYTSKVCGYEDLDKLQTYGFRGEALSAICSVADVTVTTRTSKDEFAMTYAVNDCGNIVTAKPSHLNKGTLVTVSGLFRKVPVRKNYLNSGRRAAEELKRVDNIVKSLAVIHPGLRVTFRHNKCLLWQKSACSTLCQSLMQIVGHFVSSKLEELLLRETELSVDMLVPRRETENLAVLCLSNVDCMMLYINNRPVRYKKLEKMVLKYISECFSGQPLTHKYPYCLVSIVISPGEVDANLEPNKTRVMLKEENEVLSKIENLLSSYYGVKEDVQQMSHAPDVTASTGGEQASVKAPTNQPNSSTSRGKVVSPELKGSECKRMKVDTALVGKEENVAFVRERLQNSAGTELIENVSYEERDLFVDGNIFENVVHDEMFTTNASKGWTVTKNMCTYSNQYCDSRFASRESVLETNCDEQSVQNISHLDCNELQMVSNRMYEGGFGPPSVAADFKLTNCGDEVVRGMGGVRSHNSNTETLNKADSVSSVMQETHTCIANINEKPLQSDLKDVTKGGDLSSYSNKQIELSSSSCNTVSILQDRSSLNQNFGKTDSDKLVCSTGNLVSDLTNVTRIPQPASDEDVWEAADLAMEKWSKGQVKAPNGNVLQGSSVLLRKAATTQKSAEILNSSYHSVSSQMGCKEQSAFTKFARHERPKVLQEFPGIAFTKVSEILVERWRSLSAEERIMYEKLAKETCNKGKGNAGSISGTLASSIKGFMSKSVSPKNVTKKIWQRPYRKEVALDVSLMKIKESGIPVHMVLGGTVPILIGQLHPSGTWLYKKENELGVVRHWGLQETVVYHRLMLDHSLPLKKLDSAIPIVESTLGPELWKILLSLSKTYDVIKSVVIISCDVISKNGFRIELNEGSGRPSCMLTEIASTISFYGINDLKDVLELIKKNGFSSLEKCRSQRVICYIRDETVRIVRQCPRIMERDTLQDLIRYWHSNLAHLGTTCLHRKPFFFVLRDLSAAELEKQEY